MMKFSKLCIAAAMIVMSTAAVSARESFEPAKKSKGTIAWEKKMSKNVMNLKSSYVETIQDHKLRVDVGKDFDMRPDAPKLDQSAKLQKAINFVNSKGGGVVYIPKGEYCFKNVRMASNVHIVVEENSVFRPIWTEGERKVHLLLFSYDQPKKDGDYIENCSIRATKGHYFIDFTDRPTDVFWGGRFAYISMVRNFSIADFYLKDNFTVYCATIMTPSMVKGSLDWKMNRPEDGQIINSIHTNAHPGYGLCQLHGARRIYFENITAVGGVTLRLETGSAPGFAGIFDIYARNVKNYDGYSALMMGPHVAKNGTVLADGLWSMGTAKTLGVSGGHTGAMHKGVPNNSPGVFSDDCKIINIHGISGGNAQVSKKSVYAYDPKQYEMMTYEYNNPERSKWLRGPSLCVVSDALAGMYKVEIKGVTGEGFDYNDLYLDMTKHHADLEPQRFSFVKTIPHLSKGPKSVEFKGKNVPQAAKKPSEKGGAAKGKSKKSKK